MPEPPGSSIAISSPHFVDLAGAFRWGPGEVAGPFELVILGEDYREVARFDGIEGSPYRPAGEGQKALEAGKTYAAYLLAASEGRMVKSPLVSFVWR